jgi:hypothetical protein
MACEFLPSFGLAKPLAAMFGVRLGTLTIQLLHCSAVGQIAHVSLLDTPPVFCALKNRKEKDRAADAFGACPDGAGAAFRSGSMGLDELLRCRLCACAERRGNIMRKFLLASVFVIAGSYPALAADVAFEDIIGRWCLSESTDNITFTRTESLVSFADGRNKTLTIEKVEVEKNAIHIYWAPHLGATIYELSDDRRTLVQLPNTAGDMGPRRQLRRC